jgi:predicted phosphodiesterase
MKSEFEPRIDTRWEICRRDFLKTSGAFLASGLLTSTWAAEADAADSDVKLRFGIVTDTHYADADPRGTRHYRESLAKLRECIDLVTEKKVRFLCELGDFKDQEEPPKEESTIRFLHDIEKVFREFRGSRYHVIGNHDLDSISKKQFLSVTQDDSTYYSFDVAGFHFIVLDACFDSKGEDYDHGRFTWTDANIAGTEMDWLADDLSRTNYPTIAFIHQNLDGEGDHFVKNADSVRKILEDSGKVCAVFQGHDHRGRYQTVDGIHYYTLKAVVEGSGEENNAYAVVEIHDSGDMTVTGYRKAVSKKLSVV